MISKEELNEAIISVTGIYGGNLFSQRDESKSERNARLFVKNLKAFLEEIDGSLSVSELREALEEVNEEDT